MTDSQTIPDAILAAAAELTNATIRNYERNQPAYIARDAIAKAIHDAVMAERPKLQPIATAPNRERVMVAGWNNGTKTVQGYWWWHEDVIVDGKAFEHPEATHWFPILKPEFPATPKAEGK